MHQQILSIVRSAIGEYAVFPVLQDLLRHPQFSPRVHILAIGKAAAGMAATALHTLSRSREQSCTDFCDGYVLTKYGHLHQNTAPLIALEAGHPLPDSNSLTHTNAILSWLCGLPAQEDLIVLLSGGGSALFEAPVAGISLNDLLQKNRELLHSGLDITSINAERRKQSAVKGGRALDATNCHRVYVYALSDVAGDDPAVIASGPFTPAIEGFVRDECTYFHTPSHEVFYHIIGDNTAFLRHLSQSLSSCGYPVYILPGYNTATAETAAADLAQFALTASRGIYLLGGEMPVSVSGAGLGGRCTHFALCFAKAISGFADIALIAIATDGNDNLRESAGAVVNGATWSELQVRGIDSDHAIAANDSYTALNAINAIIPGYVTGINVNDVMICIVQ